MSIEGEEEIAPTMAGDGEENIAPTMSGEGEEEIAPTMAGDGEENIAPTMSGEGEEEIAPTMAGEGEEEIAPTMAGEGEEEIAPTMAGEGEEEIAPTMAGEVEEEIAPTNVKTSFPTGRVKRIMKLDNEINKVNSEALFLITSSTDLFLKLLAEKSGQVALEKKRKTINLDHMRTAVENYQPINDFLLDSLPLSSSQPLERPPVDRSNTRHADLVPPPGTRRIDHFFKKSS